MGKVPFAIADQFICGIKSVVLRLSNDLLTMIFKKPSKPQDKYHSMMVELDQAGKTCTVSLSSLSDPEVYTLFNEMLYVRLKSEEYF